MFHNELRMDYDDDYDDYETCDDDELKMDYYDSFSFNRHDFDESPPKSQISQSSEITFLTDFRSGSELLTLLNIGCKFNDCIDELPPNLTHLSFGNDSDKRIYWFQFDSTSVSSIFTKTFKQFDQKEQFIIVNTKRVIKSNKNKWDDYKKKYVPPNFNSDIFNQPLENLPLKLKKLTIFSNAFNNPLNKLPSTLTHLTIISNNFNQPLKNLPSTLTHLVIGSKKFNQLINKLPTLLTHLVIASKEFNKKVKNLPTSLTHLVIDSNIFNQPLKNLPSTLTHFILNSNEFIKTLNYLPSSLTHLSISGCESSKWFYACPFNQSINKLPSSLTHLFINGLRFNHPIDKLPLGLTHLKITSNHFNKSIVTLPESLTYFEINSSSFGCIEKSIENLPSSITHLSYKCFSNKKVDLSKLDKLTHLEFGSESYYPIGNLPTSLTHLKLGDYFNHPIDELSKLDKLTHLIIDSIYFNQSVSSLPNSITHLALRKNGDYFNHNVNKLPDSLVVCEPEEMMIRYKSKIKIAHILTKSGVLNSNKYLLLFLLLESLNPNKFKNKLGDANKNKKLIMIMSHNLKLKNVEYKTIDPIAQMYMMVRYEYFNEIKGMAEAFKIENVDGKTKEELCCEMFTTIIIQLNLAKRFE